MSKLKEKWDRNMIDLYFFNVEVPFKDEEYVYVGYPQTCDTSFFARTFFASNKDEFIEKSQKYSRWEIEEVLLPVETPHKNKHGHYQIDVKEKGTGVKLYTFVYDEMAIHEKKNCFFVHWKKSLLATFDSSDLFQYYEPKNRDSDSHYYHILGQLEKNASFHINAGEDEMRVRFAFRNQNFEMKVGYNHHRNPFDYKSWNTFVAPVKHLLTEGSCLICGKESDDQNACPFFEFEKRKENAFIDAIQSTHSWADFKFCVNFMLENQNVSDSFRRFLPDDTPNVELSQYGKDKPYIELTVVLNRFVYKLSPILWKPTNLHHKTSMLKLSNWDFKDAVLSHSDSMGYYRTLNEFKLSGGCSFCNESYNYNAVFQNQESTVCTCLNEDKQLKSHIMNHFLCNRDEHFFIPIRERWSPLLKKRAKVDVESHTKNASSKHTHKEKTKNSPKRVHLKKKHQNDFYDRKRMDELLPNLGSKSYEKWGEILREFNNQCALTGKTIERTYSKKGLEHFLPLSIGHGGTNEFNIFPMDAFLNYSKNNKNPFVWIRELEFSNIIHQEDYPTIYENFQNAVQFLAMRNRLSYEEFEEFVNWCFDNPRSLDEVEKMPNVLSIDLWQHDLNLKT